MNKLLQGWWDVLVHHAHAGTLPQPPLGGNPIALQPIDPLIKTPPAPPVQSIAPASNAAPNGGADPIGQIPPGIPPHDDPDANGFVQVNGIDDKYANIRHAIFEVAHGLPPDTFQRACAELNVAEANGAAITGVSGGVCVEIEQYANEVLGTPDFRIKQPTTNIPDTLAWPNRVNDEGFHLGKVSGVVGWLNYLASK